ncbi:amidohydrolase family protein [Nocardioides ferulae]|uniref:amidohydrolase family protein n=1 Tax=Nocardioides ferulae TaxID=2340821 RepID=UPI001F0BAC0B|nr:amidohydrolase family protein [Nocardioides ferulae]
MTEPGRPVVEPQSVVEGPSAVELAETDVAPVRAFWEGLGLPGLFDVHVHFLPPNIQRAVWAVFDSAGPKIGREWPIRYRQAHEERVSLLRDMGVRRFPTLPYAHKPGVAAYLNDWSRDFAAGVPEVLWSGTFFPEPGAGGYVADLVGGGVEVFKVHLQVGEFAADDPLLDPVWGVLEDAGTPVVLHAGSGPVPGTHTGPESVRRLLARFPRLTLLIAHMGAPEFEPFLELAEAHERVHLDTTMVFTDFFDTDAPYPAELLPRLADLGEKVLLGSDFPTIPYPYAHQLEGLARLDLGDDWLRAVCWHNGMRLFGDPR